MNLWEKAKNVRMEVSEEITGGFSIGFDEKIPEQTRDLLMDFVYWVEDHYPVPVTLWVDFKYRHYLKNRENKPAPYLFYWVDFKNYPVFTEPDDIPVIYLPVRMERQDEKMILRGFIRGITDYFAWLTGEDVRVFSADACEIEGILEAYLQVGEVCV